MSGTVSTAVRAVVVLLALAALVAFGVGVWVFQLTRPAGGSASELEITPGMSLARVAAELEEREVVRSADALRGIMRVRGTAVSVREGLYDVSGDMTAFEVADVLSRPGRERLVWVTVPEGRRVQDLPVLFEEAGVMDAAQLKVALQDVSVSEHARGTLEGFLFPARYPFRPEVTAPEIVRAMVARMTEEFTPERVARARALGLNVHDWVTLASMVQVEAGSDAEMPVIAGVFLNRLDDGMPLGSDPTVAYGLGKDLPQLNRYEGDFTRDTPYNTYTRSGLPPGPISLPGSEALAAVLAPERTVNGKRALYFLHGRKGEFRVNADYASHLRDIARFR